MAHQQHGAFELHETLFQHLNMKPENIHIPDGTVAANDTEEYCARYEQMIRRAGGIDLQILGIGRSGHIGFNEPGSMRNSRTRRVTLDPVTRRDAASGFFGEENVPHQALTMGVGTILEARKIAIMAFGEHKAPIVVKAVEQPQTEAISASFLQGAMKNAHDFATQAYPEWSWRPRVIGALTLVYLLGTILHNALAKRRLNRADAVVGTYWTLLEKRRAWMPD